MSAFKFFVRTIVSVLFMNTTIAQVEQEMIVREISHEALVLSQALSRENSITSAKIIFASELEQNIVLINDSKSLELIRKGLLCAVCPVFIDDPNAQAGEPFICKIELFINQKRCSFWGFSCGFCWSSGAVMKNLFYSQTLALSINKILLEKNGKELSADYVKGLSSYLQ